MKTFKVFNNVLTPVVSDGWRYGNRGTGKKPFSAGVGVCSVFSEPKLPELFGPKGLFERKAFRELPEVSALLERARICKIPKVSSLLAHVRAVAV